jgi:histone H3/H4
MSSLHISELDINDGSESVCLSDTIQGDGISEADLEESDESEESEATSTSEDEDSYSEYSEDDQDASSLDDEDDEDDEDDGDESENDLTNNKRKLNKDEEAIEEIRYYQSTTNLLLPTQSFRGLVKEIAKDFMADPRFSKEAYEALQVATEDYLTEMFSYANIQALHSLRQKIITKDIQWFRCMKQKRLF